MHRALCVSFLSLCGLLASAETVVWECDFTKGATGWSGGGLRNLKATADGLAFNAPGGDTPLIGPVFDGFATSAWQRVEIEWQCGVTGEALLYYTNTTQTPYGGFSPGKLTSFATQAAPGFQTSVVRPFWRDEKKIIRLRINPPGVAEGAYVLRRIRVVDETPALVQEWPARNIVLDSANVWRARTDFAAESRNYLIIRQTCTAGAGAGALGFITDTSSAPGALRYAARSDGKPHTYNLPLDHVQWKGRILGLELKAAGPSGATSVESLEFATDPGGLPDVEIRAMQPDAFRPRAGVPVKLNAYVINHGGAATVKPRLELRGARVLQPCSETVRLETIELERIQWTIQADQPGTVTATLSFEDGLQRSEQLVFASAQAVQKADYVPTPVPAKTDYQIGVYYFPGWNTAAAWAKIRPFPERRPVLGWYREGEPEVLDWQIKWMVEHGITFMLYDWYWDRGGRHLEHGIHQALFNARFQNLIKFALLYANHNGPGSHSAEDFEAVTRFWIENYFKRPNYLRVEGKPVVVMFSAHNPIRDMGLENVRKSFERMRQMCKDAGLNGLYLVACSGPDPKALKQLNECGYDAVSCYNWPGLKMTPEEQARRQAPYATLIDGYAEAWNKLRATDDLNVIPPVCGGWDDRPWAGAKALVRDQRTPELFKRHLQDCKRFLDEQEQAPKLKMAFIEAWNELGEGSYVEPHQEFGFEYLEAVRQVFAPNSPKPVNVLPEELGRGPFDIAEPDYTTRWDFTQAATTLGWGGNVANLRVENRTLAFTTRGNDPILTSPPLRMDAKAHPVLKLRLKAAKDLHGQVFWATTTAPAFSETRRSDFRIRGGEMQVISVRLGDHAGWRGRINALRIDPGSETNVDVTVEYIGLERE